MFQELVNKWRDERVARNQPMHVTQTHMVREFAKWLDSQEVRPTPVAADWAYCPHCKEALITKNYCLHCERDVTPNR